MRAVEHYLDQVKSDIDALLDSLIPAEDIEPQSLHAAMRWSLFAGGKRIRPAIVLAVGEALGGSRAELMSTAAAIEMVHTYSLIHDDLPSMDNDDLRRGKPSCHRQFGEATAILAGDVLQTQAFKTIAEDGLLTADVRIKLISLLAAASGSPGGMASGQQLDLAAEGNVVPLEEIERIHQQKTGALISAAASAGTMIAKGTDEEFTAIDKYAKKLGLLFQITDDLLDVTQGSLELGKTAGKDASANKATYPTHLGIEGTRELAKKVRDQAINTLAPLKGDSEILSGLAMFVVSRTN